MHILRILLGLFISEDYFKLLFKFLWLLLNDFSEIVENIGCLKNLRISASYKRVGVFFVNNFFQNYYLFFFFFLKADIKDIWKDSKDLFSFTKNLP